MVGKKTKNSHRYAVTRVAIGFRTDHQHVKLKVEVTKLHYGSIHVILLVAK